MDHACAAGTIFLGQILEAQGEAERAKALFRKAIDKDPEFVQAKDELRRLKSKPQGRRRRLSQPPAEEVAMELNR